jgi:hypothetical protein
MSFWDKYIVNGFFGWNNLKWLVREIVKIGSSEKSYFSKKRIESGIAFVILQVGMIDILAYFLKQENTPMSEFIMWASVEAVICGYVLTKIEENKRLGVTKQPPEQDSPETNTGG